MLSKKYLITLEAVLFGLAGVILDALRTYIESGQVFTWSALAAFVLPALLKAIPQIVSKNLLPVPTVAEAKDQVFQKLEVLEKAEAKADDQKTG